MEKTFSESISVRASDCDAFGKMRMDALFTAMQEGGERHAHLLGIGYEEMADRNLFFVLARIHVSILMPPRFGQIIRHTTWPGEANHFFCPRYHVFSLEDGTPLAAAGALWVMLNRETKRIVSPLHAELELPDNSDIKVPVEIPIHLPARIQSEYTVQKRNVAYSDRDVNGHVNNARYMTWLCDALGDECFQNRHISTLTAGYEREIRNEKSVELHVAKRDDSFTLEILSPAAEKHFIAVGTFKEDI